jgi:hypothetical protein
LTGKMAKSIAANATTIRRTLRSMQATHDWTWPTDQRLVCRF